MLSFGYVKDVMAVCVFAVALVILSKFTIFHDFMYVTAWVKEKISS